MAFLLEQEKNTKKGEEQKGEEQKGEETDNFLFWHIKLLDISLTGKKKPVCQESCKLLKIDLLYTENITI